MFCLTCLDAVRGDEMAYILPGVFLSPRPREYLAIDVKTADIYYLYRHTPLAARVEVARSGRQFFVHGRTLFAFAPTKDGYGGA